MFARLLCLFTVLFGLAAAPVAAEVDKFTLRDWNRIEGQAEGNDAHARGLRDGYLAGIRDALRFYTRVSTTFPICWPKDHKLDMDLMRGTVNAVRREHPEIAKPEDNFAYIVVLALYGAYPCR